jgi:hypothetical protein
MPSGSCCDALSASGSVGVDPVLLAKGRGQLNGWYVFNSNSIVIYLQIFDAGAKDAIALGTDRPLLSLGIPPGGGANLFGDRIRDVQNGIVIAAATTQAGNGAPVNPVDYNIFFS